MQQGCLATELHPIRQIVLQVQLVFWHDICDKYILNYRAGADFGVDDIIIDTEFEGEES